MTVEESNTIILDAKPEPKTFNYDYVGDENSTQEEVFHKIAQPIVDSCLEGYNGTIFAYGQTGSGKTYTIQGPGFDDVCLSEQAEEDRGILPRSFEYIFNKLEHMTEEETEESKVEFLVRTSYLEIYNEQIMDLLNPTSQNLQIREDIKKGVYVEGLVEEVSSSAHEMLDLIKKGAQKRHTGSTLMNKESSRSHSVLTTTIESKIMKNGLFHIKIAKFHLIDLAGSERAKSTDAAGSRLKEAGMINKSLSALGNVINSLVEVGQGRSRHVHYRDSKLTFLLRDSLGGNSKTLMIANISPASNSFNETLSTLKFAQRAKLIKNKAIINEDSSGTVAILKDEIKRLKLEMTKMRCKINKAKQLWVNCGEGDPKLGSISDDELPSITRQMSKSTSQKVAKLETLLKQNLTQLTQMQEYYEKEVNDRNLQVKRLKWNVEWSEKQNTRDNLVIKFRDSTIKRFGKLTDKIDNDEMSQELNNLNQEVKLLRDQINENPELATAWTEIEQFKLDLARLKKESGSSEESFCALYKSNLEFIEELKDYMEYNEEQRIERRQNDDREYEKKIELLTDQLHQSESQTEGYKELLCCTQSEYEAKINELEDELRQVKNEIREQKEKEITDLKERLVREESAKSEIHAKHQNLYEEKVSLNNEKLNIEKLFEQMKTQFSSKESEYTKSIYKLNSEIEDFKEKIDNMKNSLELKQDKIVFLEEIKKTKEKLAEDKKQLQSEIQNFETEVRRLENEIMAKSDDIKDLSNQLSDAKNKITSLEEELGKLYHANF